MKNFFFIFLLIANYLHSQTFTGKIIDKKTQSPVLYANVGVIGKSIGTVSDANGYYSIQLNDSVNNSILKFSCIGYKSYSIKVFDFKKANISTIELEPDIISLAAVVIKPKQYNTKVLGNENKNRSILAGFHTNDLGSELGVIMHIKKTPTFIEKASFNVAYNDAGIVKFRVNIYHMNNGIVDSIILKEPIIVEIDKQTRVLTVDLKKYNLVVENDFLVSLEWIEGYGSDKISFCAGLMNKNCLFRKTSQDNWEKANPIGVGFNCTVTYEK
ncbi:MAG: carboxypeptidase-like regulatory domain-containing protein [Bacteroidia bacterium]|nr:carboxypeptidase-like regulatory domain-containing protein [Bacteroidia bacterium]